MKKWLLILAVGLTAASCQWWHETFDDPEECAVWYLEKMADAEDLEEFEDISEDFSLWAKDLGRVDGWKCDKAYEEWAEDNESKAEKIEDRYEEVYEKYADD